jgi:ABC-type methionine transport system permease subunit
MKKLKAHHYIILLAVCVAITVTIVALTLGKDVAISVLCTGIGCIIGLIIGFVIRKKKDEGKQKHLQ